MVGTENIRKIVFFGLAFGESIYHARESESTLGRAAAFLSCMDEAADLFTLDREAAKAEWKDFDIEERAQLFAEAADEFEIDDKHLEAKIEAGFTATMLFLEGAEAAYAAWKAVA